MLTSTLINWGEMEIEAGRTVQGVALLERAQGVIEQTGAQDKAGYCAAFMAGGALAVGEGQRALALARKAQDLAMQTGEHRLRVVATLYTGAALCALDDTDAGLAMMAEAIALRRVYDAAVPLIDDLCTYALALLDAGRLEAAAQIGAELRAAYETQLERQRRPVRLIWTLTRIAEASGEKDEARTLTDRARTYWRVSSRCSRRATARRFRNCRSIDPFKRRPCGAGTASPAVEKLAQLSIVREVMALPRRNVRHGGAPDVPNETVGLRPNPDDEHLVTRSAL